MWLNKDIKNIINNSGGRYAKWRIISILVVGLMFASALFVGQFIYQNIYSTLANASVINSLESGLRFDSVDMKAYNLTQEKMALKKEQFVWPAKARNIFEYGSFTTSTPTATTTTSTIPKK